MSSFLECSWVSKTFGGIKATHTAEDMTLVEKKDPWRSRGHRQQRPICCFFWTDRSTRWSSGFEDATGRSSLASRPNILVC